MSFDEILDNNNLAEDRKKALIEQALKRAEYNRQYQARLREVSRLITLEKRVDANLDHILGYIKTRYSKEYKAWIKPVRQVVFSSPMFDNWLLLSANEYKSIEEAFELSQLEQHMVFDEFTKLFEQHYKQNNTGRYTKD